MRFPPLKDPDADGPDGPDGPDGSDGEQPAPPAPQEPAPAQPAGDEVGLGDDGANAARTSTGPEPADDHVDDLDDDELEELNEQVDLDELEELEELENLENLENLQQAPGPDAPVPTGIKTEEAKAAGDAAIPMLTEVVQVPRYDSEDLPQSFGEVDWGDLGQRVRENVLGRLLRRSDALLDSQLQHTLTPVLERAAETIAHELHDALNRMIRDIVARAVTEELTRLHAEIAKRNRSSRPT